MADIEIHGKHRRLERFSSDIDPDDEAECVALLRRRARELKRPVEELRLVTWAPKRKRREYRS